MRYGAFVVVLAVALVGCGDQGMTTVDVSAASSLSDAFTEMAAAFEATHPGVEVRLNIAGSAALREQILSAAPVDVFASADEANMAPVVDAGLVIDDPSVFAVNRLVLAVPSGNPGGVTGIDDLARDDLFVGLCAPEVPCGALAAEVLADAGVEPAPDTLEPDVRSLLAKIADGELDVGLVYVTDAAAAPVDTIEVPVDRVTRYPIALLADAPEEAAAFVRFVGSREGRAILARFGFGAP